MTQVAAHKVVSLAFTLKDKEGNTLDQAPEDSPLVYLHGHNNLPPGIERQADGMDQGAHKEVQLTAKDAFGDRDPAKVEKIGRHHLGKNAKGVRLGDMLQLQTKDGQVREATVTALTPVTITLDFNHPLAGMDVGLSLKVLSVRDATDEEKAHGHAHGADGHEGHDDHGHDHDHDHDHDHAHEHGHDHQAHDHDHSHAHSHDHAHDHKK